jgi:hypothetical protein
MARRGFAAADARRRTRAPLRSAAYPADAALYCLYAALRPDSNVALLRYWAVVAVGFLISARSASVLGLSPDAGRVTPEAIYVELWVFKYGTSGEADPIYLLFTRLVQLPCTRRSAPFFRAHDLGASAGLRAVSAIAPPGTYITPRSLRCGGITAACAAGVPLERIMRVSNHSTAAVVLRHYLDPLVPLTRAARIFFDRFVPATRALSLPAAPVSPAVGIPVVGAPAPAPANVLRHGIL